MGMDVFARRNITFGKADDLIVFAHGFAGLDGIQRDLVTRRDMVRRRNSAFVNLGSGQDVDARNGDIVLWVQPQCQRVLHHILPVSKPRS